MNIDREKEKIIITSSSVHFETTEEGYVVDDEPERYTVKVQTAYKHEGFFVWLNAGLWGAVLVTLVLINMYGKLWVILWLVTCLAACASNFYNNYQQKQHTYTLQSVGYTGLIKRLKNGEATLNVHIGGEHDSKNREMAE